MPVYVLNIFYLSKILKWYYLSYMKDSQSGIIQIYEKKKSKISNFIMMLCDFYVRPC